MTSGMQKKLIITISLAAILITLSLILFWYTKPVKTTLVTLNETGFTPQNIQINKGDVVIFKTSQGQPFWPASDLHPTHGIYPEFDPQEPIDPQGSWQFKFDKKGSWKYHDHLNPFYRGVITVK